MSTYREPGRDIDMTAVETAKIHEVAETKRKLIEEREKTRRADINERDTAGYVIPRVVGGLAVIGLIVAVGEVTNTYVEGRRGPGECHEESAKKDGYSGLKCTHVLHVLVQDEKTWTCKCGTPKVQ